jgi:putative heme iron utilization protein
LLFDILSEIIKHDDVLIIIRNDAAVSEVRSNSLSIRQKEKWITIGENEGPAHMHIDSEMIKSCEFVTEEKPDKTSFSVRFFDDKGNRLLAAFFTKMYGKDNVLDLNRKQIYDSLQQRFGSKIKF